MSFLRSKPQAVFRNVLNTPPHLDTYEWQQHIDVCVDLAGPWGKLHDAPGSCKTLHAT